MNTIELKGLGDLKIFARAWASRRRCAACVGRDRARRQLLQRLLREGRTAAVSGGLCYVRAGSSRARASEGERYYVESIDE